MPKTTQVINWRSGDVFIRFTSDKLSKRKGDFATAGSFSAIAFQSDMPLDVALAKMRKYIIDNNPELSDTDFELSLEHFDHLMSGYPPKERVLHITENGCTLGPPH
jgi:hypothetical protein